MNLSDLLSRLPFILLLLSAAVVHAEPAKSKIEIIQVTNDSLTYTTYNFSETKRVDLSDLIVSDQALGDDYFKASALNGIWSSEPDFKLLLLKEGLAKLRNPASAPKNYVDAQEKARTNQQGVWAPTAPIPPQTETPDNVDIAKVFAALWYLIVILSPLGVGGLALAGLYYMIYVRKRISLLVIGERSSGKTAIHSRLLEPDFERQKILDLAPSAAREVHKLRKFIQYAKFEIHPKLINVPGSAFSTVWDEYTRFRFIPQRAFIPKRVVLLTLAPTMANDTTGGDETTNQKYIDTQLMYVHAFIQGPLGARKTRKPKVIVLFLNKFDLFSAEPPGDSTSADKLKQFKSIFAEHIEIARIATDKAAVPFEVMVGSALENWSVNTIIDKIGKNLYGA